MNFVSDLGLAPHSHLCRSVPLKPPTSVTVCRTDQFKMGGSSSQPAQTVEAPPPEKTQSREVKALLGLQLITLVLAEYYAEQQLWEALDQSVEYRRAAVGHNLSKTEDDSEDLLRLRKGGATAMKVDSETEAPHELSSEKKLVEDLLPLRRFHQESCAPNHHLRRVQMKRIRGL